jgi:hypothetical protein
VLRWGCHREVRSDRGCVEGTAYANAIVCQGVSGGSAFSDFSDWEIMIEAVVVG